MEYRPKFYDLKNGDEAARYAELVRKTAPIVVDRIEDQIAELILCDNPEIRKVDFNSSDAVAKKLADAKCSSQEYGVWVYYPWKNHLVHILPEEEFIRVRTNRNVYKITPQEQELLSGKIIGIAGLSVGRSVALTCALQRLAGEIRLADFDNLELSNLNRIKVPLHELGVNKAVSAAREIAELDPFIKVTCFTDGLHKENIENFFLDGGKLDLFIEECDDIEVKIFSRIKAQELHVPVVMETSDNCVLDVERFDLEPHRPIIHGYLEGMDLSAVGDLQTQEEKLPYITKFSGIETLSPRMKSSMIEIDRTIRSWPQLASDVTYGGGVVAKVSTMILLDKFHKSGRFFIDVEGFLTEAEPSVFDDHQHEEIKRSSKDEVLALISEIKEKDKTTGDTVNTEVIKQLVQDSIRGTTAGNLQMFNWVFLKNNLYLLFDSKRGTSFLDSYKVGGLISLGSVLESLTIGAQYRDLKADIDYYPIQGLDQVVARVRLAPGPSLNGKAVDNYKLLHQRFTNRSRKLKGSIEPENLNLLANYLDSTPVSFQYITDRVTLEKIAEYVGEVEKLRIQYPPSHNDLYNELKFPHRGKEIREGINIEEIEMSLSEKVGFVLSKDQRTLELLNELNLGSRLSELTQEFIRNSSGFGLLTIKKDLANKFLEGGRVLQRFWMEAQRLGISIHPFTSLMFFEEHIKHGTLEKPFDKLIGQQIENTYAHFDILDSEEVLFVFRFLPFDEKVNRSLSKRRPINEVLYIK